MARNPVTVVTVAAAALVLAACSGTATPSTTTTATTTTITTTTTTTTTPPATTTTQAQVESELQARPDGIGDPYFPELGNTGYDVAHYDLEIAFNPASGVLRGTTTVAATATADLDTFNLDFVGLDVITVLVDDVAALHAHGGGELTIAPATPLAAGSAFEVTVRYRGEPASVVSPLVSFGIGWSESPTGQIYIVAEPDGARTWFPNNDHPTDKATFEFRVTVPSNLTVAANGTLVETFASGDESTWVWEMSDPMAPYLAMLVIGDYEIVEDQAASDAAGVTVRNVLPPDLAGALPAPVALQGEMIAAFSDLFGPYPFDAYGLAVVDGFQAALENQSLSIFGRDLLIERIVAHELAHQWFGDHVSPARWQDVWLNEGFASYGEWLWAEQQAGFTAVDAAIRAERDDFAAFVAADPTSYRPPGVPPADDLFNPFVYRVGAMTLHALRIETGDEAFFEILRTYVDRHGGAAATTDDFVAVAEEITELDLSELFEAWLFGDTIPEFPSL
jgi:aminopeptidase N